MRELPKQYDPKQVEDKIYAFWLNGKYFHAERDPEKKPFTIVIPPPNVTGQLHLGHAVDETIQDVLIRYKRMKGFSALWLPGYDHAGIATQIKVEENLRNEEGLSRFDLGRDKFLERVWDWKNKYGDRIVTQLKTLGSSCDWDRQRFTMDEGCSKAVREVFCSLYEKGLIYKGKRIINWCPHCTTALSDAEVEYEEKPGKLWHLRYPLADGSGDVIVATTRPETMLGDTGVAVNPNDERYTDIVGKSCILPLMNREIPIVADEYVEMEFGTGCVKMTPCHDPNDFEVGLRHNLEQILVIDDNGCIINGGKYDGMDRYEARKAILADLEEQGYLVKIEDHLHNVREDGAAGEGGHPRRGGRHDQVRPRPLLQNIPQLDVQREGLVHQPPALVGPSDPRLVLRRLRSRHRLPGGRLLLRKVRLEAYRAGPRRAGHLVFLRPVAVFHPGLAGKYGGYDIIFFWVARMIFSGMEHMKREPFHTVLIHGLIRDPHGKKMSKSAGNGVDPIDMIDRFGADALRFNLITGNSPGNDMRFYTERCEAMRNFANKLWNAARYVMMNLTVEENRLPDELKLEDKWILSKLNALRAEVNENLDKYELGLAATKIYEFIWDSFCDWFIEITKPRLREGDTGAQQVLLYVLSDILKLLHPFMPFITEEIYGAIPHDGEALIIETYPEYDPALDFKQDEADFESIMTAVKAVRSRRAEMNVPPSKRPHLIVATEKTGVFEKSRVYMANLAYAGEITVSAEAPAETGGMVTVVTEDAKLYMPMAELVDLEKEKARIEKELQKAKKDIEGQQRKLANENFVARAPEAVVNAEREKLQKAIALAANLEESLKSFG